METSKVQHPPEVQEALLSDPYLVGGGGGCYKVTLTKAVVIYTYSPGYHPCSAVASQQTEAEAEARGREIIRGVIYTRMRYWIISGRAPQSTPRSLRTSTHESQHDEKLRERARDANSVLRPQTRTRQVDASLGKAHGFAMADLKPEPAARLGP